MAILSKTPVSPKNSDLTPIFIAMTATLGFPVLITVLSVTWQNKFNLSFVLVIEQPPLYKLMTEEVKLQRGVTMLWVANPPFPVFK